MCWDFLFECICFNIFFDPTLLLSSSLDKPWLQVSPLPPGINIPALLSRIGFSIPTARRFSSGFANSRPRAYRDERIELYHIISYRIPGIPGTCTSHIFYYSVGAYALFLPIRRRTKKKRKTITPGVYCIPGIPYNTLLIVLIDSRVSP